MNSEEEWRPVADMPDYEVSSLGHVRSVDRYVEHWNGKGKCRRFLRGRTLAPSTTCYGYLAVTPGAGPKRRQRFVHALVLEAFVGPAPDGCIARHLNGNRQQNLLDNLAWGTPAENADDRAQHGRTARLAGEAHGLAKLTEEQVRQLRAAYRPRGREHIPLAASFGIGPKQVWNICNGRRWRHVPAGAA